MAGAKIHIEAISIRELSAQVKGLVTDTDDELTSSPMTADELVEIGVAGASPEATRYSNGDIVGSSANGEFTMFKNQVLLVTNANAAITTSPITFVGTITKLDTDKMWVGVWA